MREIKFRAWCKGKHDNLTFSKPYMEYGVFLSEKGYYCGVDSGWDIQGEYKTIPIMQCTGIKDSNGKEIYEGDILWNNIEGWKPFVVDDIRETARLVKETDVILGNIYEDANLLKK